MSNKAQRQECFMVLKTAEGAFQKWVWSCMLSVHLHYSTSMQQFFGFPSGHDPQRHAHAQTTRAIGFIPVTHGRQSPRSSNTGTFFQNYFFTTLSSSKLAGLDPARRSWIMQHLLWQRGSTAVAERCRCVPWCPKSTSRQEIKTCGTPSEYQLISI